MAVTIIYILIGIADLVCIFLDVSMAAYILSAFVFVDFMFFVFSSFKTFGFKEGFDNFKYNLLFMAISFILGMSLGLPLLKIGALYSVCLSFATYSIITAIGNKIIEVLDQKEQTKLIEEAKALKKQKKLERKNKKQHHN